MLLLPGSLPTDRATLKASCEGLAELSETASLLQRATVAEYSGSWSDAEREASGDSGDLNDGVALAQLATPLDDEAVSVAIATPIHAALGLTDLTPIDPSKLSLSADESRLLCEASDMHMHEDGVRLHFVDAARWLVTCNLAVDVLTERPDWIIGELLRPNLPRGRDARLVERWMNELQMLLHAHPVNIAREEKRLPPVNLVWLWGFGSASKVSALLPPSPLVGERLGERGSVAGTSIPTPPSPSPRSPLTTSVSRLSPQGRGATNYVEHGFARALREGDLSAWQATWANVSREILSAHTVILGDSRPRLRLTVATPSITERLLSPFKRKLGLTEALTKLQQSR